MTAEISGLNKKGHDTSFRRRTMTSILKRDILKYLALPALYLSYRLP